MTLSAEQRTQKTASDDPAAIPAGFKRSEVGLIPRDWNVLALSQVSSMKSGVGITGQRINEHSRYPCYGGNGLRGYTDQFTHRGQFALIGRQGALCGNVVKAEGLFFASEHAVVVTASPQTDVEWLTYVLRDMRLSRFSESSAQPGLSVRKLLLLRAACPPTRAEQHAIAEALSDVDALLGSLDALITKKRAIKQAAMQQLLTGETRLPGFSGEWGVKPLGEVTALIPGGVYGEEKGRDALFPYHVATTAHIEMNDTWNCKEMKTRYFTREQIDRYLPQNGDLIVVKSSGSAASIQSGKIGFVDQGKAGQFIFSNFLMLLRPTRIVPQFLYYYLCSYNVKKLLPSLVEASTYPNIRIPEYLALGIPLPRDDEQTAIATVFSHMDAELEALEARRDKTRGIKQGMMQQLLTGRIRLVEAQAA